MQVRGFVATLWTRASASAGVGVVGPAACAGVGIVGPAGCAGVGIVGPAGCACSGGAIAIIPPQLSVTGTATG